MTPEIVIDGTGGCEQRADKVELDLNFEAEAGTRAAAVEAPDVPRVGA